MELRHTQQHPPPRRPLPKRLPHSSPKDHQAHGIEPAQYRPHDELRVLEPSQRNQRLAHACEEHRPDKRPRHGAREAEVVVRGGEPLVDIVCGRAVDENVVRGLEVEGLFDFGVGGGQEVQQRHDEEEEVFGRGVMVSMN